MSDEFYWLAVAITTIISAARITRVATFDAFPPARWLRNAYGEFMDKRKSTRGWVLLAYCPWCFSFWATLAVVLWGYYSEFGLIWWLVNGSLAGSYLAAIFVNNDTDTSGDEDEESD